MSITTIGTNGVDIIDVDKIVADGIEKQFSTSVRYTNNISAFVTINGVFQRQGAGSNTDYDLIEDDRHTFYEQRNNKLYLYSGFTHFFTA